MVGRTVEARPVTVERNSRGGGLIALTGGELVITTNATIVGPGPEILAVSGNNASRMINGGFRAQWMIDIYLLRI